MPRTKQTSKRRRQKEAMPVLGAVGVSLSLASGASAATAMPAAETPSRISRLVSRSPSMKRKSPTSVWGRSMSSTRRTPERPGWANNLPEAAGVAAAEGAEAAAEAAEVVAVAEAAAAVADAAGRGAFAASARAFSGQSLPRIRSGVDSWFSGENATTRRF